MKYFTTCVIYIFVIFAYLLLLTHFSPVFNFHVLWKNEETKDFLTFSGDIEMEHWVKSGLKKSALNL